MTTKPRLTTTLQGYRHSPLLISQTFEVDGRYFSLGVVPKGSEGRRVFRGPMVAGPWGFVTTHASVIASDGLTMREREGFPIVLALGQPFEVDGLPGAWRLMRLDRDNLDLRPAEPDPVDGPVDTHPHVCPICGLAVPYAGTHPVRLSRVPLMEASGPLAVAEGLRPAQYRGAMSPTDRTGSEFDELPACTCGGGDAAPVHEDAPCLACTPTPTGSGTTYEQSEEV